MRKPIALARPSSRRPKYSADVPAGPRGDRAVGQAQLDVRHDQLRVDLLLDAQARALRARAVGRVEGERARLEVVERERVPVGAGHALGEAALPVLVVVGQVDELEHDQPVGEPQRRLHRVGEPLLRAGLHRQPVDHHGDVVLLLLLELRRIGELVDRAVDEHARVALRPAGSRTGRRTRPCGCARRARAPGTARPPPSPTPGRRSAGASASRSRARTPGSAARPPGRRAAAGSRTPR